MFEEYDSVRSVVDINSKIHSGARGVIVMVLDKKNKVYEVEFFDDNNKTIDVTEVKGEELMKVNRV